MPSRASAKQEAQKERALPNLQKSSSTPAVPRNAQAVQREGQHLPRLLGSSSQPAVRKEGDRKDKAEKEPRREQRPQKKPDANKSDPPKSQAAVKPEDKAEGAKAASREDSQSKAKEDVEIVATREMRRELLEVLSNPQIRDIARKYYDAELRGRRGTGRLGFRELRHVLRELNQHLGLPMPAAPLAEQLFKRYDFNGDGDLSFEEFFELFVKTLRRVAFDRSVLLGREIFVTQEPGKVWDVYHRVKTLGEGSFGSAHLGKHKRTKEERVIKVVEKSQAKLPVEDIEKEIMVLRQVDHPHIIRLHEWYEGSSKIYLVMDAIKGGTLREVLLRFQAERAAVEETWSRSVMKQTLQAMAYCHGMRIIHKDLKDENVMLLKGSETSEPFVVIIDLGVSEMFSSSDPHGKLMGGTPMTMAPEVWENNFGPKCDVWSAGCILYEMLAGSLPFAVRSMNPKDWQALHRYGPDWRKVKTSSLSRRLCQEMLTYSDTHRPTMLQCLQHKWFGAKDESLGALDVDQLKQLQEFSNESALKRAVIMEVASKLPIERAERIAKVFEKIDENSDGSISMEELSRLFSQMGLKDRSLQNRAFQTLDINGDGVLSFSEFSAGVLTVYTDLLEDRFLELFRRHDVNGDGMLSRAEFEAFMEKVLPLANRSVQQSPAETITKIFGHEEDLITFEEMRAQLLPRSTKKRR